MRLTVPCFGQVFAEDDEPHTGDGRECWRRTVLIYALELNFQVADLNQPLVSASLQLASDLTIFGVNRIVFLTRPGSLILS